MHNVLRVDVAQVTSNQIKSFKKIISAQCKTLSRSKSKFLTCPTQDETKAAKRWKKNIRRGKKVKKYHFLSQNCFRDVIINQTRLFLSNLAAFSRSIFLLRALFFFLLTLILIQLSLFGQKSILLRNFS